MSKQIDPRPAHAGTVATGATGHADVDTQAHRDSAGRQAGMSHSF